jgi:hypothetical protein
VIREDTNSSHLVKGEPGNSSHVDLRHFLDFMKILKKFSANRCNFIKDF